MSRYSFAVTILAASAVLTASVSDAFVHIPGISARIRPRSFVATTAGSDSGSNAYMGASDQFSQGSDTNINDDNSVEKAVEAFVGEANSSKEADDAAIAIASVLEEAALALNEANEALLNDSAPGVADVVAVTGVGNASAQLEPIEEAIEDTLNDHSIDEEISLAIANASKTVLGPNTSRNYVNTRQTLRDARGKNEKRISRSTFEKEKSAEKIAGIRARMEEQIAAVESELEEKLIGIQKNFDEEMIRVRELLTSQANVESNRLEKISVLKSSILEAIESKTAEIKSEETITEEMVVVRSKLKTGNISNQLDALIEEKRQVSTFEQSQLEDLNDFVSTIEEILKNTQARKNCIDYVIENLKIVTINQATAVEYDFSDFHQLETMWEDAAVTSEAENVRIAAIKKKFDDEFLNKLMLLGDPVPVFLEKTANELELKKLAQISAQELRSNAATIGATSNEAGSIEVTNDVNSKGEYELLGMFAKSLSSAAVDSAKAGVLGIKAVIDTANKEELSQKLKSTTSMKKMDEESLKAIGEAGRSIANNVGKSETAAQANSALKDTSEDLGSAFKALGALGKKAVERIKDN